MIIVTQLPFVATLVISFMNWNALLPGRAAASPASTTSRAVFTDADLRDVGRRRPILLTAAVVLISLVLGLVLALLLDRKFRGRGVVRTMMITPFLIVPVAAALLWKHALYNPEYGLFNGAAARGSSVTNAPQPDWITDDAAGRGRWSSLVWQWTPFMMLILLAGLQSRPLDVDRGGPDRRRQQLADLPLHDPAAPAPLPGAGRAARLDLHRAELRRGLHDHLRRPGHGQPAVHRSTRPSTTPTTTARPPPPASSS